ncbi:MAG: sulfotransferase family protein [Alphaproteobacteria bacterium]|nr:sulfotransferase family protein [Alphaproteobacteria bacterium]
MLLIPKLCLGYQNIPKVATTSIFSWLYQAYEASQTDTSDPNFKRQFFLTQFKCDSLDQVHEAQGEYLRFAVTRDPVRRFLSMYGNRVVAKRQLGKDDPYAPQILDAGLRLDPQLNELIDSLSDYLAISRPIYHHCRPQLDFLGEDLSIYDLLMDVSQSDRLCSLIRRYWKDRGLKTLLSASGNKLQKLQTGGPKISLAGISRQSFDQLLEFYQSDYETIPTLDQEEIKTQFMHENGGTNLYSYDFSREIWKPPNAVPAPPSRWSKIKSLVKSTSKFLWN